MFFKALVLGLLILSFNIVFRIEISDWLQTYMLKNKKTYTITTKTIFKHEISQASGFV